MSGIEEKGLDCRCSCTNFGYWSITSNTKRTIGFINPPNTTKYPIININSSFRGLSVEEFLDMIERFDCTKYTEKIASEFVSFGCNKLVWKGEHTFNDLINYIIRHWNKRGYEV